MRRTKKKGRRARAKSHEEPRSWRVTEQNWGNQAALKPLSGPIDEKARRTPSPRLRRPSRADEARPRDKQAPKKASTADHLVVEAGGQSQQRRTVLSPSMVAIVKTRFATSARPCPYRLLRTAAGRGTRSLRAVDEVSSVEAAVASEAKPRSAPEARPKGVPRPARPIRIAPEHVADRGGREETPRPRLRIAGIKRLRR